MEPSVTDAPRAHETREAEQISRYLLGELLEAEARSFEPSRRDSPMSLALNDWLTHIAGSAIAGLLGWSPLRKSVVLSINPGAASGRHAGIVHAHDPLNVAKPLLIQLISPLTYPTDAGTRRTEFLVTFAARRWHGPERLLVASTVDVRIVDASAFVDAMYEPTLALGRLTLA